MYRITDLQNDKDPYNTKERVQRQKELIRENKDIDEEDQELLFDFVRHKRLEGIGPVQQLKYLHGVKKFLSFFEGNALSCKAVNLKNYLAYLRDEYKSKTASTRWYELKPFMEHIGKEDVYDGLNPSFEKSEKKLPEELLTKEEISSLMDEAHHLRDKAFIACLYESGCRIGEFLPLQVKHENYSFEEGVSIVRTTGLLEEKDLSVERNETSRGDFEYVNVGDEELLRAADGESAYPKDILEDDIVENISYCKSACRARIKAERSLKSDKNILLLYRSGSRHYSCYPIDKEKFEAHRDTFLHGTTDEIALVVPDLQQEILSQKRKELYRQETKDQCEKWISQIRSGNCSHLSHDQRRKLGVYLVLQEWDAEEIKELMWNKLNQYDSVEEFDVQYRSWKNFVKDNTRGE